MPKKFKEIVINDCHGGFGLSYEGTMEYASLAGFKLYPFVETKIGSDKFKPYEHGKDDPWIIYYSKKPLKNGKYDAEFWFDDDDIERDDPNLIKVVKKLGEKANGQAAKLKIVKIPQDVPWQIDEYDGAEWVSEKHRCWD